MWAFIANCYKLREFVFSESVGFEEEIINVARMHSWWIWRHLPSSHLELLSNHGTRCASCWRPHYLYIPKGSHASSHSTYCLRLKPQPHWIWKMKIALTKYFTRSLLNINWYIGARQINFMQTIKWRTHKQSKFIYTQNLAWLHTYLPPLSTSSKCLNKNIKMIFRVLPPYTQGDFANTCPPPLSKLPPNILLFWLCSSPPTSFWKPPPPPLPHSFSLLSPFSYHMV